VSSVVSRGTTSSVQGRKDGPQRALCEVLAYRRVGAYHSLTLVAPEMAEQARPGQFIAVGVEGGGTLLRRPFSIYDVSRHGPWAGTIREAGRQRCISRPHSQFRSSSGQSKSSRSATSKAFSSILAAASPTRAM
jgi:hypothetical protein